MPLAFLNLGPSEVFLVLVLFLVLFGAQKVPELARSLGRAKAELDRTAASVKESIQSEEERELARQLEFERLREHQIRGQQEDAEHAALVRAASELGLVTAGKGKEELKADIAAKLAAPAEPDAKGAAGAPP